MAEVFSHLIKHKNKINKNDIILTKKIIFIKSILFKIDNSLKY